MKRLILSAVSCSIVLIASAEHIIGSWSGRTYFGLQSIGFVFNIEGDSSTVDFPDEAIFGLPVKMLKCTDDSLVVEIPEIEAVYRGKLKGGLIEGWVLTKDWDYSLDLNKGKPIYRRTQNPQPPFQYRTEEVFFENPKDNAVLKGTLSYPINYEKGQTPIVLLVSGSGLQNRDYEMLNHRPFAVISDYLARYGVATLRYDDRSVGKSTGDVNNATVFTFADDAEAGIQYLRDTKSFGEVGILGHDQGGSIAFMLAGAGKTDFIVCIAGYALRGDKILVDQERYLLSHKGYSESFIDEYCRVLEKVYEYKLSKWDITEQEATMIVAKIIEEEKVTLVSPKMIEELLEVAKTNSEELKWFISYEPAKYIRMIKCPVMAIHGEKDVQILSKPNLTAIRENMECKEGDIVKEYKGLNHLMQHCYNGALTEYLYIEETISPEVLSDIVTFVQKQKDTKN